MKFQKNTIGNEGEAEEKRRVFNSPGGKNETNLTKKSCMMMVCTLLVSPSRTHGREYFSIVGPFFRVSLGRSSQYTVYGKVSDPLCSLIFVCYEHV